MGEFKPDWTLAPAAALREWMEQENVTVGRLAMRCMEGGNLLAARCLVNDVLAKRPLGERHAAALERGAGIAAQFWLNYERIYRADLARGATDTTPAGETP